MGYWEMLIDFGLITGMLSIILVVSLLLKFKKSTTSRLIILLFFNVFCLLLHYYGFLHQVKIFGAVATFFGLGMGYFLGPVIFFLVQSFFGEKIYPKFIYHLIPFFSHVLLFNLPLALFIQLGFFKGYFDIYAKFELYIYLIECSFFLFYISKSFSYIKQTKIQLLENYSSIERSNFFWLKELLIGFFIITIFAVGATLYELIFGSEIFIIGNIIAILYSILCLYLGIKGIFQTTILLSNFQELDLTNNEIQSEILSNIELNNVDQKNVETFSQSEILVLKNKLDELMNSKKLYREFDLSLNDLSKELNISNRKLSELLNQHLETNFYNLINEYRIQEVKEKLSQDDYEKYTIMAIAYDCGFQSKASFYRIFKQKVGVSPAEFAKQNKYENTPSYLYTFKSVSKPNKSLF
jgi:AraC-like DNA-binding protein